MSELIACHHKVTLDIAKRDVCTIEVVNQDTANILEVNVCENGKEVSLENATLVTITYSNDTVEEMQISEDFKTASVRINANCLKRGINFAKVCIYSGDNGLITAEMLTINCKQTVGSDNPSVPDPDMPKLKEMIEDAVAQAGGGAGLKPLVGTTQTITPSQVLAAIKEGRDVALQYEDSYYGTFVFSAFNANERLGIVVSNSILPQMNGLTGTLLGFVEDAGWIFKATNTATKDDVGTAVDEALTAAKASGEFDGADGITPTIGENGNWFLGDVDTNKPSRGEKGDIGARGEKGATGADGKSAYSYAQDGGYIGTEAEFAAKLAAEKLPNPYPLTFTGAVNETYDGSSAKTITIPSGGGGGSGMNLSLVYENTFESVAGINETIDALNGKENFVFNIEFTIPSDSTTAATIIKAGLYNGEFYFPIAYYVGYGNYSTAYPKKAAYGSFLKLGEGLWERIRLKAISVELFGNQNNLVGKDGIAFQYLKDNQNSHAAGLRIDFNQTMESVKIQIYAG